jgi:hypothetical protein
MTDDSHDTDDFEADWDLDDTQVPDDEQKVEIPGMGEALVYYASEEIAEEMTDGEAEFGNGQLAEIIREHYVSPGFDGLDGDDVRGMHLGMTDKLLRAIAPHVDFDVDQSGATATPAGN